MEGLTYNELKSNIMDVIKGISNKHYKNILEGVYKQDEIYVKKLSNKTKVLKNYL